MSMIILEAHANDMLFMGDEEEGEPPVGLNVPLLH